MRLVGVYRRPNKKPRSIERGWYEEPGGELLSHSECYTTIVAAAFHF